jgi:uncharacterized membrane protein
MLGFSTLDLVALGCFVGAWVAYALLVERSRISARSMNAIMDGYRLSWMQQMLRRENRIVDTQIMASLANGTAFFASTSLISIGGALTLLRSPDEVLHLVAALPFGGEPSRTQWEAKVLGLAIIFAYAFFKFAWPYRLFNYVAILLGAAPPLEQSDTPEAQAFALRAAKLIESAGRHFNRGQRGFFLALGYLGWFLGPWVLMVTTTAVLFVIAHRQFASESREAITATPKA